MSNQSGHNGTLFGTVGGTLLSVFANLHLDDIVETMVLAFVGAATSFVCSVLLKHAYLWAKGRFK